MNPTKLILAYDSAAEYLEQFRGRTEMPGYLEACQRLSVAEQDLRAYGKKLRQHPVERCIALVRNWHHARQEGSHVGIETLVEAMRKEIA